MAVKQPLVVLSIPGLRSQDVDQMPALSAWSNSGDRVPLQASFPAVTWPVQANMLTGVRANQHGVVANGFYWRDTKKVEMWTAWNDKILRPQIWDTLHGGPNSKTSAVWFPMLSKGCGADYICMPAPVHNPDGSESLWCYTKPTAYYGELLKAHGHFPLKHFWGPLAGIPSSDWIAKTAVEAMQTFQPDFFYIYIPHLDYAAQKLGPNSPAALQAVSELNSLLASFFEKATAAYADRPPNFLLVSEYVITDVDHVSFPNRMLREAGLLRVMDEPNTGGELLDLTTSDAWALVDHQFSHVFVRDADPALVQRVAAVFAKQPGIEEVLVGEQRARYGLDHERSGEVVLVSTANSWQAYYWWLDDAKAPSYARTVDIHRKPGYDPVELHFDPVNRCIPLNAQLIRGSHGAPPRSADQIGVAVSSRAGILGDKPLKDVDIYQKMLAACNG